ncbi:MULTISPECIES: zinc ribbon domain-containing protein [Paenibacillus]|uniref:zinc ribbon domain-containing protein n=1 Tax=Paenibacillus TaxID=44249 RepID=UPI002FDF9203
MVNYCSECGVKLAPGSRFCPECGTVVEDPDLAPTVPAAESAAAQEMMPIEALASEAPGISGTEAPIQRKKRAASAMSWIKRHKWVTLSVLVFVVILGGLYAAGAYLTDGNRVVSRFEQAIKKGDAAALASLLQPEDKALTINKDTVIPLLNYLKKDEFSRTALVQRLRDQAAKAKKAEGEFTDSEESDSNIVQVKKSGKKLWLFDNYTLVVAPIYPYVETTFEGTKISVDGKEMMTSDEDYLGEKIGPLIPGTHEILAEYEGKFAAIEKKETVTFGDALRYYDVNLDLEGSYITVVSDEQDAAIFIDDKDTGLTTGNFKEIGPLLLDGSSEVYIQKEYPWGLIRSEKLPIRDSYIRIGLEPENDAFRQTVQAAAKTFFQEMVTAMNTQDTSKAAHLSEPVKQAIHSLIQELKAEKAVYSAKVKKIAFDLDSIKLSGWDGEYKATVNMKVDLSESVHPSADPSTKKTEDTSIQQTLELTYLEDGQWIVTNFYDSYNFNDANTEEVLL